MAIERPYPDVFGVRMAEHQIDVETLNTVRRLLTEEIMKYPAGSAESMALFKFKEILNG